MYQTYFVGKKATDRPMEMSIGLYVAKGISYREFLYADYPNFKSQQEILKENGKF